MIPLVEQVVSLSLAQEMKKLGYKQEGYFWWIKLIHPNDFEIRFYDTYEQWMVKRGEHIVAPTFPEVSKALPPDVYVCQKALWYKSIRIEIDHIDNDINKPLNYLEAFAKMWIYLKKG